MAEQLRLMAVHAHPDDESSRAPPPWRNTSPRGGRPGRHRHRWRAGQCPQPQDGPPRRLANIGDIRRAEMDAARAILGVEQAWLGFVDSGLPEGDPLPPLPEGCFALQDVDVAAAPLVRLMRQFRPHVVTTYDEEGGYPHPDHIMTHKVTVAAFDAAGDPDRHPDLGEPWQPLKLYYDVGFSRAKIMSLHEAVLAAGSSRRTASG
ncbi:PIG-L family deacetylase [Micromonospora sp. BRA006-A]|nr:PIG-L family deacetylase [Micromonospora sp. BRA006-A]